MSEILVFLFKYYEIYFVLLASICGYMISYACFRNNKKDLNMYILNLLGIIVNWCAALIIDNINWLWESICETSMGRIGVKGMISLLMGMFSFPLLILVGNKIKNKYTKMRWIKKNRWGFPIAGYLLLSFVINVPMEINCWVSAWYACDYSMGIGSRRFIGTLLTLFYDDFLDWKIAWGMVVISIIMIIVMVSIFLNKIIIETKENIAVIYAIILFLVMPGSISSMWTNENFGRLEMYGLLLALMSIGIFNYIKNVFIKYIIITIISVVSMAIYQGNAFTYYPIILMIFIYDGLDASMGKIVQRRIMGFVSVLITMCSFLYFQFVKVICFENATEMANFLKTKTNLAVTEMALDMEIFQPISEAFMQINVEFLLEHSPRELAFLSFILILPVVIFVYSMYFKCHLYRKENKKKSLECPYFYYIFFPIITLPQFVLNVDWGRWMTSISIVWFAGIFYLIYKKENFILRALGEIASWIQENITICVFVVLFVAGLDKFMGRAFIQEAVNIYRMTLGRL